MGWLTVIDDRSPSRRLPEHHWQERYLGAGSVRRDASNVPPAFMFGTA